MLPTIRTAFALSRRVWHLRRCYPQDDVFRRIFPLLLACSTGVERSGTTMPPRLLVPRVLPAALSVRPKPPRVALIHPQGMRSRLPNLGDYLSCFIQAPPNEFKEHKRTVVFSAVLTGQSWGQSCSGLQSSVTQTALRRSAKAPLPLDTDHSHPTARSSSPNKTSACHSPNHLQADHRGGGHTNMPEKNRQS
jgi:hypothetical protein